MNRDLIQRIMMGFAFGFGFMLAYDYLVAWYWLGYKEGDFNARKNKLAKGTVIIFPRENHQSKNEVENITNVDD